MVKVTAQARTQEYAHHQNNQSWGERISPLSRAVGPHQLVAVCYRKD